MRRVRATRYLKSNSMARPDATLDRLGLTAVGRRAKDERCSFTVLRVGCASIAASSFRRMGPNAFKSAREPYLKLRAGRGCEGEIHYGQQQTPLNQ